MPVSVVVELPPVDSLFLSEETLAGVVLAEFLAARRCGTAWDMPCSVSCVRLQQLTRQRYPQAYGRLVQKGRWKGKWHRFVRAVAGLRCFVYSVSDYTQTVGLDAHTAPGELRCCLADESPFVVRRADGAVGTLLLEHLLREEVMSSMCTLIVQAAPVRARCNCRRGGGGSGNHHMSNCSAVSAGRPLWRTQRAPPLVATLVERLATARSNGWQVGGGLTDRLRHGAANEITSVLVEENQLARHVSVSQLRRHVLRCVIAWERAAFAQQPAESSPGMGGTG